MSDDVGTLAIDAELSHELGTGQERAARRPLALARLREPALYGAAAVSYVSIGVFVNEFVLSWVPAFAWLLLWVWALPAGLRRLRRR